MDFIYGVANDQLLVVEASRGQELAALWKAKTSGQLERKAPRLYGEAIELLREAAEYAEWDDDDEHPFEPPRTARSLTSPASLAWRTATGQISSLRTCSHCCHRP